MWSMKAGLATSVLGFQLQWKGLLNSNMYREPWRMLNYRFFYNARTRGLSVLIIKRYLRRQKEIMSCMCWDWPWKLGLSAAHCEEIPNWWCFPNFHCAGWTFWGRSLPQAWMIIIFYPSIPNCVCIHQNVIFNSVVTHSSLQLAS